MTRMRTFLIGSAAAALLAASGANAQNMPAQNAAGYAALPNSPQAFAQLMLAQAGNPVLLREQASVSGPDVTLGDLFRNIGERAAIRVATAPAPGERMVFDASALAGLAAAYGVAWQAQRWDRVVVERPGQRADSRRLEQVLSRLVAARVKSRQYDVEMENRGFGVTLPAGVNEPRFDQIRVDERTRQVTALVAVPESGDGERMVSVSARLHPLVDVPVLRSPVMPGTPIGQGDIEWIPVRATTLNQPVATDIKALVGLIPRRPIVPGEPIKLRDLDHKILVQRNGTVTLLLRSPAMQLTTQAKALEDGAEGASIRVQNLQSQITVEALVTGPDTVEVRLPGWQPARLAANQ